MEGVGKTREILKGVANAQSVGNMDSIAYQELKLTLQAIKTGLPNLAFSAILRNQTEKDVGPQGSL